MTLRIPGPLYLASYSNFCSQSCLFYRMVLLNCNHSCADHCPVESSSPDLSNQRDGTVFECCTITSPVCCSNKLPWEGPLLWPRLSAICCSRGTSTEVSHDRDCRSPGRSSSLSWEGSVVRSLQGRNKGGRGGWLVGVNTAVSSDTRTPEGEFKSKHLIEHLFLQSQNHCNEAECGETDESCPVKLCISHAMQDLP